MNIMERVKSCETFIIERRQYYHAHPELSGEEVNTCTQIEQDLRAMGISDITRMKKCHGLIATIHGGKPGKTIGLRTDIDALKVEEKTGLPFAATNGCMHACGHDTHIAILLGAARALQEMREELCGNVRLIVQPAEELASGAKDMIAEGALDGVDAIYGNHVMGGKGTPSTQVDVSEGPRFACAHMFVIDVEGFSAHGSAPHAGIDAIAVSAAIINALQQCVSRQNNPRNPLVLTIGTIHGGSRFNIIPNHVTMEGTVRTYVQGTAVEERMRKIIESTAEAFGAKATLSKYLYMTHPVVNEDALLNRIAKNAVVKTLGEQAVGHFDANMGGEDFSWYGLKVPSFFATFGSYNEEKGHIFSNHHEKYDVEPEVFMRAAAVMTQFAVDYLEETCESLAD